MSAGVGGGLFAISSLGATQVHVDGHEEGAAIRIESPALSAVVALHWRVAEAVAHELLARAAAAREALAEGVVVRLDRQMAERQVPRGEPARAEISEGSGFPVRGRTLADADAGGGGN